MKRYAVGTLLVLVLGSVSAFAATTGLSRSGDEYPLWSVPYEKALDLIKHRNWQAAIPHLLTAVAARHDTGSEVVAQIEGVFTLDYHPQYLLSLAYLRTGDLGLASAWLSAARQHEWSPQKRWWSQSWGRKIEALTREIAATTPAPAVVARAGKSKK